MAGTSRPTRAYRSSGTRTKRRGARRFHLSKITAMKIALDETITLEFDAYSLTAAGDRIAEIRAKHSERADDVLNGILTILLFRQIEKTVPGTFNRLVSGCRETQDAVKE